MGGNVNEELDVVANAPLEEIAATEGDGERVPWLPKKFQTPEALAQAYTHAEQKITEQSYELGQLRAEIEAMRAQVDAYEVEALADPANDAYLALARQGDLNALNAIELATRERVTREALQRVPGLAEQLAAEAAAPEKQAQEVREILNAAAPDWQTYYPRVEQTILRDNLLPADADANTTIGVIVGLTSRFRAESQEFERAKLLAQTATGAGTRMQSPDQTTEEWSAIRAAGAGTYSDAMGRR